MPLLLCCPAPPACQQRNNYKDQVKAVLRQQALQQAEKAIKQLPITVTSESCPRSAGGPHDFYSEGDYWWPNPVSADSPYIQKDGHSNPDNFTAHRQAMIRFSQLTGALASAYLLTGNNKYVRAALPHYKAWFTDTATCMHPSLLYAQAIKGRFTGRGIGIIDGIQLMEAIQALRVMASSAAMDTAVLRGARQWVASLLQWLTTHPYGKDEMNALNNHGTCWVMQVAVFARFTTNKTLLSFCSNRFKQVLLPGQMAANGSFPLELKRTKAYGYSIFNLDAMAIICQTLSVATDDLWTFQTPDGKSIKKGIDYLYPFIADKDSWPLAPDVMYWNEWPVAQPFLVFGAQAFNTTAWFNTWKKLDHAPAVEEVIRNLPVRNPLIWMEE